MFRHLISGGVFHCPCVTMGVTIHLGTLRSSLWFGPVWVCPRIKEMINAKFPGEILITVARLLGNYHRDNASFLYGGCYWSQGWWWWIPMVGDRALVIKMLVLIPFVIILIVFDNICLIISLILNLRYDPLVLLVIILISIYTLLLVGDYTKDYDYFNYFCYDPLFAKYLPWNRPTRVPPLTRQAFLARASASWLVDWLGWSDWLVGWLVRWFVWLVSLVGWLVGCSAGCLIAWFAAWRGSLTYRAMVCSGLGSAMLYRPVWTKGCHNIFDQLSFCV